MSGPEKIQSNPYQGLPTNHGVRPSTSNTSKQTGKLPPLPSVPARSDTANTINAQPSKGSESSSEKKVSTVSQLYLIAPEGEELAKQYAQALDRIQKIKKLQIAFKNAPPVVQNLLNDMLRISVVLEQIAEKWNKDHNKEDLVKFNTLKSAFLEKNQQFQEIIMKYKTAKSQKVGGSNLPGQSV
jgi:hypothetical protein